MSKIQNFSAKGSAVHAFENNAAVEAWIFNNHTEETPIVVHLLDENDELLCILPNRNIASKQKEMVKFFVKTGQKVKIQASEEVNTHLNILQETLIESGRVTREVITHQNTGVIKNTFTLPSVCENPKSLWVIVDSICHTQEGKDWSLSSDGNSIVFHKGREPHSRADILIIMDKGVL